MNVTFSQPQRFPEGTSIGAYLVSDWPGGVVDESAAPPGSAVNSQTVSSGSVTFTGLTAGTTYVVYGVVGGQKRYTRIVAGADVSTADNIETKSDEDADVAALQAVDATKITGPASAVSGNIATFSGTTGKLAADSGKAHSTDGTLASNSDAKIPTEKAVKTYADLRELLANKDTDNTLAANSDTKYPSQKATKGYVDTQTGLLVPKSLVDAKGDLFVGTADNTVARKAVGSDGQRLVADSSQSDGLKWGVDLGTRFGPPYWYQAASATLGANTVVSEQLVIPERALITGILIVVGATNTGNVRVALSTAAGVQLGISNSTALGTANTVQQVPFTSAYQVTTPGKFVASVVLSSGSGTVFVQLSARPVSTEAPGSFTIPSTLTAVPSAVNAGLFVPVLSTY